LRALTTAGTPAIAWRPATAGRQAKSNIRNSRIESTSNDFVPTYGPSFAGHENKKDVL
jgi:hypothetical protein